MPERFLERKTATEEDNDDEAKDKDSVTSAASSFNFLPFAGGPRNCIGQHFAMIEARIVLALLMRKFDWTVLGDEGNEGDPAIPIEENGTIRAAPYTIRLTQRK